MTITYRATKGTALTHAEMDENLRDLHYFTPTGTGAVLTRTKNQRLNETISVKDFGAVGDGVTDDTAAIQAAINTGNKVNFVGGTYACSGLVQSTNFQCLVSSQGYARLIKNANGVLLTCSGSDVQIQNISFRGDAATPTFTGDNVNATGNNFAMLNCGSRWTSGRALKSTGSHTQIIGQCDIYQTTDASASGYDIELGISGTNTRYHMISGIYTSQSTGGLLFTDCGGQIVQQSQFGKLNVAAGTLPAGVNGGMYVGNRILGAIDVSISNAVFTGNQFGAVVITLGAGTSGHKISGDNIFEVGYSIVNNTAGINVWDTCDGYKEGTFLPVVEGTSGAGTANYTVQVGRYTRIGNRVFINARVNYNTHTGTGNTLISGLPYAAEGSSFNNPVLTAVGNSLTFSNNLAAIVNNGVSTVSFYTFASGGGLTALPIDAAAELIISGHYESA